jgi:predicted acetyltransferase
MTRAIHLIEPDPSWQSAFLEMAAEYTTSGDLRYQAALSDFAGSLERRLQFARGEDLPRDRVRETTYWAVEGTMIVGCSRLRHTLTPALQQIGGHIGYEIRPTKRGQGYGTALLARTLERARQFGIPAVLMFLFWEQASSDGHRGISGACSVSAPLRRLTRHSTETISQSCDLLVTSRFFRLFSCPPSPSLCQLGIGPMVC